MGKEAKIEAVVLDFDLTITYSSQHNTPYTEEQQKKLEDLIKKVVPFKNVGKAPNLIRHELDWIKLLDTLQNNLNIPVFVATRQDDAKFKGIDGHLGVVPRIVQYFKLLNYNIPAANVFAENIENKVTHLEKIRATLPGSSNNGSFL